MIGLGGEQVVALAVIVPHCNHGLTRRLEGVDVFLELQHMADGGAVECLQIQHQCADTIVLRRFANRLGYAEYQYLTRAVLQQCLQRLQR